MINNRQNGRRRGRGGQQPRNGQPGVPDRGNRLDNRARGNAAQLLEKYKSLARDAQMAGDRVNTEYYLQFADHYFRILAETRSRFEEGRPPRRDEMGDDQGDDGEGQARGESYRGGYAPAGANGDADWNGDEDERPEPPRFTPRARPERQPAEAAADDGDGAPAMQDEGDLYERRPRQDREPRARSRPDLPRAEMARPDMARAETARPEAPRSEKRAVEAAPPVAENSERIEVDRLPAGFGTATSEPANDPTDPRPRRRTRRPRAESGTAEA